MRILLITSKMESGGAESHVYDLAKELERRGNRVTVVSGGGAVAQRLLDEGLDHRTLPIDHCAPIDIAMSYRGLRRILREDKYDVIHAHSRLAAHIADRARRSFGVPLVTTIHARLREDTLLHRLSRWGEAVIAVSEDLRSYLKANGVGVPIEGISVIPNGIDTERFSPNFRKRDGERRIVFLSRLDPDCSKTAFLLCGIAPRVAESFENTRIMIGGGGEKLEEILSAAKEANRIAGREIVEVLGRVFDVADLVSRADVFVGVSRAALEAMSCAIPVVLSGDEGFWGVVSEKDLKRAESTNFCCRGESDATEDKLYASVASLLALSDTERRSLGLELREYVALNHSAGGMAQLTEELYHRLLPIQRNKKGGILICGYYGFGNIGDDILLSGAIRRAKERVAGEGVCVLTKRGRSDGRVFGVRCAPRGSALAILREIARAGTVVFGGGTLLQKNTSARSLWYYLMILRAAQIMGKRVELWANGAEKIEGRLSRSFAERTLRDCHHIGVRDTRSKRLIEELIGDAVVLERDLAEGQLACVESRAEYLFERLGLPKNRRIAVISPKGTESAEMLESFVKRLCGEGITPIYIAMFPMQDIEICRQMQGRTGGVLLGALSGSDVMGIIRRAYLVCAMRYHCLALAAEAGVSFIGFGDEEKIRSICDERGGLYCSELPDGLKVKDG